MNPSTPVIPDRDRNFKIAILIPCLNEATTIAKVVGDFKTQLSGAQVVVGDNDSTDRSAELALAAGAQVIIEKRRGKGYVVQSLFRQIEAEIYVLVDGDDTYPADQVHQLVAPILAGTADIVVGSRLADGRQSEFHSLNRLGNLFYQSLLNAIFGTHLTDILSGYRALSQCVVKSLPLFLTGFEVETELTIKALERGYRIAEVPVTLRSRPPGSTSKIRILHDGWKILWTILALARDYKPLNFFGIPAVISTLLGLGLGLIPIIEYLNTGLVLRFPTAILAVALVLWGGLLLAIGLVLHTINRRFRELEYYVRSLQENDGLG
jgi:glycosyltransferase involved in cell wall biosynthesis